jgi:DNA polymerase III delta prime subunit
LDSVANVEAWIRAKEDLHLTLNAALREPSIAESFRREDILPADARLAVLENPAVLDRIRIGSATDWSGSRSPGGGVPPRKGILGMGKNSLPVGIALVVTLAIIYSVLLANAWAIMPWTMRFFCVMGQLAVAGLVVLRGRDTVTVINRAVSATDPRIRRDWVLREVVLPELREFINGRQAPNYGTELEVRDTHLLYQSDDESPTIITLAGQRLRRILDRSTCESVAIAGHRGVGKSTTIRAVARGMYGTPGFAPPLPVTATAPSRYEARDFVLYLHSLLCKQIVRLTGDLLGERRRIRSMLSVWRRVVPLYVSLAVLISGMSESNFHRVIAYLGLTPTSINAIAMRFAVTIVIGTAVLALIGIGTWLPGAVRRSFLRWNKPELVRLRAAAQEKLDRIRFLQTYTSGWSGKLSVPLRGEVGWTRSRQRAEQQLTHPEIVEDFRDFAEWSARVLTGAGVIERMVIAIDELDKISQADKAHEFINDIKGIFGVNGCVFLVSVSDDAIAAFERRGIPVRDAFDSAFSEMVRMDGFMLEESKRWLGRRLLGVPEQFSYLCHCMSGGIPRDLRRTAIDMVDAIEGDQPRDLGAIARVMVDRELERKAHAFAAAARDLDDCDELTGYVTSLLMIPQARTLVQLIELAATLAPHADRPSVMPRMRWQSAAFVLFCATILEIFTGDLGKDGLEKGVDQLAIARSRLGIDPQVSWRIIKDVRDRYGCLALPQPPG